MFPAINYCDPKLQPGAVISLSRRTDRAPRMCEVVETVVGRVTVVDCRTESVSQLIPMVVLRDWKLVRRAPSVPSVPNTPEPSTSA